MRSGPLILSAALAACSPAVDFPVPPIDPEADAGERSAQYEDYQLTLTGNWFTGYRYTSPYTEAI